MSDPDSRTTAGSTRTRLVMSKWGDRPHWEFTSILLGSDASGDWYGTPVGTVFTRPGQRFLTETEHVVLVPRAGLLWNGDGTAPPASADFVATFYAGHPSIHTYVDITTPPRTSPGRVACVDLDLDVVRNRTDDLVWVDDEDEFLEHQVIFGYPPEVIADARSVCTRVRHAVERDEAPFDGAAQRWLELLASLAR
jgi:hypothetical protein